MKIIMQLANRAQRETNFQIYSQRQIYPKVKDVDVMGCLKWEFLEQSHLKLYHE